MKEEEREMWGKWNELKRRSNEMVERKGKGKRMKDGKVVKKEEGRVWSMEEVKEFCRRNEERRKEIEEGLRKLGYEEVWVNVGEEIEGSSLVRSKMELRLVKREDVEEKVKGWLSWKGDKDVKGWV
jgi:hypothetical protein